MNAQTISTKTFDAAKAHTGWHSDCDGSPKPSTRSIPSAIIADGDGWDFARERTPVTGYEYAITEGCEKAGFARVAATYFRLVRRVVTLHIATDHHQEVIYGVGTTGDAAIIDAITESGGDVCWTITDGVAVLDD